nr:L611 [uncultured bacterium]
MRRWLSILLLVFLPFQFSWAAVAGYCQHETGAAAQHFGHHDHQHQAAAEQEGAPDAKPWMVASAAIASPAMQVVLRRFSAWPPCRLQAARPWRFPGYGGI